MPIRLDSPRVEYSLGQKLRLLNWGLVLIVCAIAGIGIALLYSAAGRSWDPWASRQAAHFAAGFVLMLVVAMVDVRIWLRFAYLFYAVGVLLLVAVELMGRIGMGAQRWIEIGGFNLQPSEPMKLALVLVLARYFHTLTLDQIGRPWWLLPPLALLAVPAALVFLQPNLGTTLLMVGTSGAMFLVAGVRLWKFGVAIAGGIAAIPIAWQFLHDYQRQRVYTFLDPSRDPLGHGYNITQSKIAFGAGGLFGKGFGQGTQSQLRFLPERQTDFLFTVLGEEFGLAGTLTVLGLYVALIAYGMVIAVSAHNQFGRLVAAGMTTTFFLYLFVNVAMITGLIPVVGIPLALVSYGGTALMTVLIGVGLLMSVSIHRDVRLPRVLHAGAY